MPEYKYPQFGLLKAILACDYNMAMLRCIMSTLDLYFVLFYLKKKEKKRMK